MAAFAKTRPSVNDRPAAKARPIAPPPEREGYEIDYGGRLQRVSYTAGSPLPKGRAELESWWKRPATEARLGLLVFGGGMIWATKVQVIQTVQFANLFQLLMKPGPLETAAIGLLMWLHAKWRRAVRVR
jgi:hypothetical protein